MEFEKFTGKTLEDALSNAASAKGCEIADLTYNVIEEKAGFLGIGKTVEIEAFCEKDIEDFIKSIYEDLIFSIKDLTARHSAGVI